MLRKKGGVGAKPHSLGCFCAYIGGCPGISATFIFPSQNPWCCLLDGWKGFAEVFINNHTKSMVGRVLLTFLLIITPKTRGILGETSKKRCGPFPYIYLKVRLEVKVGIP